MVEGTLQGSPQSCHFVFRGGGKGGIQSTITDAVKRLLGSMARGVDDIRSVPEISGFEGNVVVDKCLQYHLVVRDSAG